MVLSIALLGVLAVVAGDAGAKVLPYQLDVSPTTSSVGEPVTITVQTDPANDLGNSFDFEIAVYRPSALEVSGRPSRTAKPVRRIVMVTPRIVSTGCDDYDGADGRNSSAGIHRAGTHRAGTHRAGGTSKGW